MIKIVHFLKTVKENNKIKGDMARKRKVYIPKSKALGLVILLIAFSAGLLYVINRPSQTKKPEEQKLPSIAERFEQDKPKEQNKAQRDTSSQKSSTETTKPSTTTSSSTESSSSSQTKTTTESSKPQGSTVTNSQNTSAKPEPNKPKYDFPKAQNNAQLIFVFDDGGQNLNQLSKFLDLPFPITVAVLPGLAHSKESAQKIRKSGNEVMLHQPMQAITKTNLGPGAITSDMSEDQIVSTLFTNITELGPIAGINNHEGSAITADEEKMAVILKFTSENELFFLDSRTNAQTKVPYVAHEMGFTWYERNIFLDNVKTKENALAELKKGLALANKNGTVIMIGHIWSADFLPEFLKEVYPELKKMGYRFSVVSKSDALKY